MSKLVDIWNGSKVLAYDSSNFINDIETPVYALMKPAIVLCRYGYRSEFMEKEFGKDAGI